MLLSLCESSSNLFSNTIAIHSKTPSVSYQNTPSHHAGPNLSTPKDTTMFMDGPALRKLAGGKVIHASLSTHKSLVQFYLHRTTGRGLMGTWILMIGYLIGIHMQW
jgi:hypothetical protein